MNNPRDNEMEGHNRSDTFIPSLDYTPVPADQVRAHLAEVFDKVESMSPDDLDKLVQDADQVDIERIVLWDDSKDDFDDDPLGLLENCRLELFQQIPADLILPHRADWLFSTGDMAPNESSNTSFPPWSTHADAISREWERYYNPTPESSMQAEICRQLIIAQAESQAELIRANAQRDAEKWRSSAHREADQIRAQATKEISRILAKANSVLADANRTRQQADLHKEQTEQEISRQKEQLSRLARATSTTTRRVRSTAEEVLGVLLNESKKDVDHMAQWRLHEEFPTADFSMSPYTIRVNWDFYTPSSRFLKYTFPESAAALQSPPATLCDFLDKVVDHFFAIVAKRNQPMELGRSDHGSSSCNQITLHRHEELLELQWQNSEVYRSSNHSILREQSSRAKYDLVTRFNQFIILLYNPIQPEHPAQSNGVHPEDSGASHVHRMLLPAPSGRIPATPPEKNANTKETTQSFEIAMGTSSMATPLNFDEVKSSRKAIPAGRISKLQDGLAKLVALPDTVDLDEEILS